MGIMKILKLVLVSWLREEVFLGVSSVVKMTTRMI